MPRADRPSSLLALALAILPLAARPDEAPPPDDRRHLAGHAFMPTSSRVDAPFAVSSIGLDTNLAYGTATGPFYDDGGNLVDRSHTYTVGGFGETIRIQGAVTHHLVLRGTLTPSLISGLDSQSALVVGTTVVAGGSLGAEWSFAMGERARLGFSLDVERAPQLNLLVAAAVLKALHDRVLSSASALEADQILTFRPGVGAAWVPTPALGLTARAFYAGSRLDTESYGTLDSQVIGLGAAADLDLQRFWREVPVSVNLALVDAFSVAGKDTGSLDGSLGVMFTGKQDVVAGVILGGQHLRIRPQYPDSLPATVGYLDFLIRVYWP
jgi:hypothetical protein